LPVRSIHEILLREKPSKYKIAASKRKTMLKNCVLNRISEIRELKKKPKLGDVLKYFKS
jgi:hypothetical protein